MLSRIDKQLNEIEGKLRKQIILALELNILKSQLEQLQSQIDKLQESQNGLMLPLLSFQKSKMTCKKLLEKVVKMLAVCRSEKPLINLIQKKMDIIIDIGEKKKFAAGKSLNDVLIDDLLRLVLSYCSFEEMHLLRNVCHRFNEIVPTVNVTTRLVPISIPGAGVMVMQQSAKKHKTPNSTVAQIISRVGQNLTQEQKAMSEDAVVLEMRRSLFARCNPRGVSIPVALLLILGALAYGGGIIASALHPDSQMSSGATVAMVLGSFLMIAGFVLCGACCRRGVDLQNETNLPDVTAGVASLITRLGVRNRLSQFTSVVNDAEDKKENRKAAL